MKKSNDEFIVESTPVIDLRKHGMPPQAANQSANDGPENWSSEKTEVYVDAEDDSSNARLTGTNGETYPITAFPFVIGRGSECDLVTSGKGVSRKHAEVVYQSGRFVVNDLDSLNGIKVNGFKVKRVILEEGDTVKLGDVTYIFNSGEAKGAATPKKARKTTSPVSKPVDLETPVNPFEAGKPAKKGKLIAVAVGSVFLLAGVGLFLFGGSKAPAPAAGQVLVPGSQAGQQAGESGEAAKTAADSDMYAPTADPVVSRIPSQNDKVVAPPSISAPPPSLASLGTPAKNSGNAEASKPAQPARQAASSSPNASAAAALLSKAQTRYLSGDADALFKEFARLEQDTRLPADQRSKLKSEHETLARVYALYSQGKANYVGDKKAEAFSNWSAFLEQEKALFKDKRSVYADQIAPQVIEVFVAKGNEAANQGRHRDAYQLWDRALTLGDSVAARIAIENAGNKARQLYRQALRLEYVDATRAKSMWQEVVELVPADNEYHIKSKAKLDWYARQGS